MKTKDLSMLLAGLFLVGCSADEEIANVSTSESNAISFNVVSNNPQTKATMIKDNSDLQNHPFEVFAFKNNAYYMGSEGDDWKDHGVELHYNANRWDYTDPSATYYWPHQEALDFYAVSPADEINVGSFAQVFIKPDVKQFSCYLTDENKDVQVDAMYATAFNITKEKSSNGMVSLQFKHALSQVVFQARKNSNSQAISVEIIGMQIYNVCSSGSFTFPSAERTTGTWNPALKTLRTIDLGSDPIVVLSGEQITNLSLTKPLLCIPQMLIAWEPSPSNPITETGAETEFTDSRHSSFLRIQCKIHDGDHYFVGSADTWGYTYVPFGATWEEGKRYIYTLYFGAGYNANGSEIDIVPITFDAEVTNWVDDDKHIDNF